MTASHPLPDSSNETLAVCARDQACMACFEVLMARVQVPLLHHLLHCSSQREEAEDLLQETMLSAYRNLSRYDSRWRFITWIFAIAHHRAVSASRKKGLNVSRLPGIDHEISTREEGPFDSAARIDFSQSLWAHAGAILEPDAFAVVWFTYIEGMNAGEVAVVIGKTANAVRILLSRSRVRLADLLPAGLWSERTRP